MSRKKVFFEELGRFLCAVLVLPGCLFMSRHSELIRELLLSRLGAILLGLYALHLVLTVTPEFIFTLINLLFISEGKWQRYQNIKRYIISEAYATLLAIGLTGLFSFGMFYLHRKGELPTWLWAFYIPSLIVLLPITVLIAKSFIKSLKRIKGAKTARISGKLKKYSSYHRYLMYYSAIGNRKVYVPYKNYLKKHTTKKIGDTICVEVLCISGSNYLISVMY